MKQLICTLITLCIISLNSTFANEFGKTLPMRDKGASTYYINGHIKGFGKSEFMVDTGSGYTTINENTLQVLKQNGNAIYLKDLRGILADGSEKIVPVYRISRLTLGDSCELQNVEAAIFPGKTRHILGLSTLKKTGTFTFSFEPPSLTLENCKRT